MSPIVVRAFVSESRGQAPSPENGINFATISHIRGPNSATPGPNDSLFDAPQSGNVQLNFNGVNDTIAGLLSKGKRVKITIEDDTAPTS